MDHSGNVGINNSNPGYTLDVLGATGNTLAAAHFNSGNGTASAYLGGFPSYGVYGQSTIASGIGVQGSVTSGVQALGVYGNTNNSGSSGILGINTSSGYYCYIGFQSTYSLLCSGPTSGVSDARLKNIVAPVSASSSLAGIMQLQPIVYTWKGAKMNTGHPGGELGFTAQNVQSVFPLLVGTATLATTTAGMNGDVLALSYDRLIVPAIAALQELNLKLEDLAAATPVTEPASFTGRFFSSHFVRITAWLADATNGIGDLFAGSVHAHKLCADDVCVTRDQLAALLASAGQSPARAPSTPQSLPITDNPPTVPATGSATSTATSTAQ